MENEREKALLEALTALCRRCEMRAVEAGRVLCPFRSISNDYCADYEKLRDLIDKL